MKVPLPNLFFIMKTANQVGRYEEAKEEVRKAIRSCDYDELHFYFRLLLQEHYTSKTAIRYSDLAVEEILRARKARLKEEIRTRKEQDEFQIFDHK